MHPSAEGNTKRKGRFTMTAEQMTAVDEKLSDIERLFEAPSEAEEQGQATLGLWQRSPIVYAFQWTARLTLLAVAMDRGQIPQALDHACALLDPRQQKLPEPLETAQEATVQAGDAEGDGVVLRRLEHAIQVAQDTGYL
jgi:hypothetical protein